MAAAYQTLSRAAVPARDVDDQHHPHVGGSLGTAVLTVVLERRIVANVPGATGELGALERRRRRRRSPSRWPTAFGQTFWVAAGLTALALIPAWFLPRRPAAAVAEPRRAVAACAFRRRYITCKA